jgi:hypothetical protein
MWGGLAGEEFRLAKDDCRNCVEMIEQSTSIKRMRDGGRIAEGARFALGAVGGRGRAKDLGRPPLL